LVVHVRFDECLFDLTLTRSWLADHPLKQEEQWAQVTATERAGRRRRGSVRAEPDRNSQVSGNFHTSGKHGENGIDAGPPVRGYGTRAPVVETHPFGGSATTGDSKQGVWLQRLRLQPSTGAHDDHPATHLHVPATPR
jgi:hypothetical protein